MKNNYQEAQDEFNEIMNDLSPYEKEMTLKAMAEMQKQLVLHEPWTIAHWSDKKKDEFLKQYTLEEQARMAKRIELEYKYQKDKEKGFG